MYVQRYRPTLPETEVLESTQTGAEGKAPGGEEGIHTEDSKCKFLNCSCIIKEYCFLEYPHPQRDNSTLVSVSTDLDGLPPLQGNFKYSDMF